MPTYTAPGVYIEEVASSQKVLSADPTAITAFVGFTVTFPTDDPKDPECLAPRLITSWADYERSFGGFSEGCVLPISVKGYFENGGKIAYICRIPNSEPAGKPAKLALPAADNALGLPVKIESLEPDANISVAIDADDKGGDEDAPASFTMTILENGVAVETFPGLDFSAGKSNVATAVTGTSTKVKVDLKLDEKVDLEYQTVLVKPGVYDLKKADPTKVTVKPARFAGSESARAGIGGLTLAEDVTIVVVPDLITAARKDDGTVDLNMWKAVQTALIGHCQLNGRMAILDAPPEMTVQQIKEWRSDVAMYDSAYAALYYPWVKVANPDENAKPEDAELMIPPSGHIAGVWARVDDTRGVWKAPANETIAGVLDLESNVSQNDQSLLNPIGINCIRPFGTRGMRIWGARTLSSDTDWNYINVRRLFNMVEGAILKGTQYAVFEPNDVTLWEGVRRTVSGFLRGLWTQGALFGASADEAFFVRCDETTNPAEVRDAGQLVVEVGIAPVKPAEFVIFKISQKKEVAG